MTPTSPDANSPLATLRELKDLLDAGAITQSEYDALKQRLLFGASPEATILAAAAPASATPPAADEPAPPTPYLDTPAALTPEATPLLAPEPDWQAASAAPLPLTEADDAPAERAEAERRNPLNLIFALGGLVLFLAVVAYLALGRRADEHVSSQSQTAADSATVAPEVGPQAEQLVLPPATGPDTVRVVPATPPPAATVVDQAAAGMDSTAAMPENLPLPKPKAATKATPAAPVPAATPAAPDTTRR